VGRHAGRSDGRIGGTALEAVHGRTSTRSAAGVITLPAHGHGGRQVCAAVADPWWDDAPVPPPVVVASADGRTPAVTFAPDADPFSAGGLFAPAGGRDGEPSVVVHPAPDAAVTQTLRRPRPPAPAHLREDVSGPGGSDGLLDTGSLVRPYVPEVQPDLQPDLQLQVWADSAAVAPVEPVSPALPRRPRRAGGPLDRIVEPAPSAGEWSAPWSRESEADQPGRSLFEPAPRREPEAIWAAPREQQLPSRKALRAQERAGAVAALPGIAGSELAGRTAGRRIAKSGVLAVTAMGVVAASAPNAFPALGWRLPAKPTVPSAQAALVGFPAAEALSVAPTLATHADSGDDLTLAPGDVRAQRKADEAAAARAGAAATGAGRSFVDLARRQVLAEAARKQAIAERASRNVLRDPRAYARLLVRQRGWAVSQFACLNLLWNRESGWNWRARNASSGAYGIPQALPGSKMATIGADWRTNPITQIKWGLNYIVERYGTPCGAWGHSQALGWY
jgi:hypothetical protein